jgi:DNA-binding MarR family transcriptional regulator
MASEDVELLLSQVKALSRRMMHEQPAVDGISTAALVVLTQAAHSPEPLRPGQLATELGVTTPNMAVALRVLEEAGMVRRRPDATDGRKVWVDVTKRGRLVVDRTSHSRHAWLQEAVGEALNNKERQLLFQAGALIQRVAEYELYASPWGAKPRTRLTLSNLLDPDERVVNSSNRRGKPGQSDGEVPKDRTRRARRQRI